MATEWCDTHGWDLPCKQCLLNRLEDAEYLERIKRAMETEDDDDE